MLLTQRSNNCSILKNLTHIILLKGNGAQNKADTCLFFRIGAVSGLDLAKTDDGLKIGQNYFYQRMRKLIVILILFFQYATQGQNLVLNKTWSLDGIQDQLSALTKISNNAYYALGVSRKLRLPNVLAYQGGSLLCKMDNYGDTIWVRDLKTYGYPIKVASYNNKLIVLVATQYDALTNLAVKRLDVLELDTNGSLQRRLPFNNPNYRYSPQGLLISSDSCYVIYGNISNSPTRPGFQCDWFMIKFNPRTNITEFEKYYNPGASWACDCYVENASGGGFLVSGVRGNSVGFVHTNVMGDTLEPI
jgi:hypothetical protein